MTVAVAGNSASKSAKLLRGSDAGDGLWFVIVDGYAATDGGVFSLTADL